MKKKGRYDKDTYSLIDQDYWSKLSAEDRDWLNEFNNDHYNGQYNREGLLNDEQNKDAKKMRSARRKDLWTNMEENWQASSAELDEYKHEQGMYAMEDDDNKLYLIEIKQAMDILVEQTVDELRQNDQDSYQLVLEAILRGYKIISEAKKRDKKELKK